MVKILHFADAHIDMANYGRHDPETGLPMRVMDFLKSLDEIVDAGIEKEVDLVIFAGDAYKGRNPAPTYQREWEKRIMRLSRAGILVLLVVGNHDLSPGWGHAHTLAEFATLDVPNVRVIDKACLIEPDELGGIPLQVIAFPWFFRSKILSTLDLPKGDKTAKDKSLAARIGEMVDVWIEEANPDLPIVLTMHASVEGAVYGGEHSVMLGHDLVLPLSLVNNPKLDYVALGHIHKAQNLTENQKDSPNDPPPVVYPGSIERVNFGEAADDKYFVIADVEHGRSRATWFQLGKIRPFLDRTITLESRENITQQLFAELPATSEMENAIVRLVVNYPREWEAMLDDAAIREYAGEAFEFHLVKRPQFKSRVRLPDGQLVGSMNPLELLDEYWTMNHLDPEEAEVLNSMAVEIMSEEKE